MSDSDSNGAPVDPALHPAQAVIQVFGGIRPMAHKLGIAVSTVQGWKERGTIPRSRHGEIQAAAASAGLALDPALLAASDQTQAPTIEGVGAPVAEPPAEAPAAADDPAPQALHPDRRPPGWLSRVTPQLPAILLGGVLVVAGFLLAMGTSDLWLSPSGKSDGAALSALDKRLAALEAATPADSAQYGKWLTELEGKLEALRHQVAALPAGGDTAALDALRQELEQQSSAAAAAAVKPLAERLATQGAQLDEALKTLADLQARLTSLPAGDQVPDWAETLKSDLTAALDRITALEATSGAQAAKLGALDGLDQRIAAAVAAAEARLQAAFDAKLQGALAALPPPTPPVMAPGDTAAATLALAAADLQEAVATGRSFEAELALVRQLAAESPAVNAALATLEPLAPKGLPSESSLEAAFPAMAEAVVRAEQGQEEGDWLDEIWHSVGSLVSVRPIGEVEGDSAKARVARAEQRLQEGDLGAAVEELQGLAGAPAEAAAGWLADAKARIAGLAAAKQLVQQALARLAGG